MALLMFNQTAALTSSHIGLPVNLQQSLQYTPSGLLQYITFTQEEHLRENIGVTFKRVLQQVQMCYRLGVVI